MIYRVEISPEAQKEIQALSGYVRAQALRLLHDLSHNPLPARAKELRDRSNIYRIWLAGRWRIVYEVDDENRSMLIMHVRLKAQIDYDTLS
jgi:mRNA-degrading endonuclease RelE of RelBE toxin-antitoxin system